MKEFDSIIGYDEIKNELMKICDALKNREAYEKLGVPAPRGLLLSGDPGLGKTLMANCLIAASGRKAFLLRKEESNGDFIKMIRETFRKAADEAPSIIFLDDLDKFSNSDSRRRDTDEFVTVQSCIDEIREKDVFVLATANEPEKLPQSLRRSGRLGECMEIESPDRKDAAQIIRHYLQDKKYLGDLEIETLADLMTGKSCADLENVINEAGVYAGFARSTAIETEHIIKAFLHRFHRVDPNVFDRESFGLLKKYNPDDRSLVICHEAGHAAVQEILAPGSVCFAYAFGKKPSDFEGFVKAVYPESIVTHMQWDRFEVLTALAGRAADDLIYGRVDCGSSSDLSYARDLLDSTIRNDSEYSLLFPRDTGDLSQDSKALTEKLAMSEMLRAYQQVKALLAANREFLCKIAEALAEKKILLAADIRSMREECVIVPLSELHL